VFIDIGIQHFPATFQAHQVVPKIYWSCKWNKENKLEEKGKQEGLLFP
jgi:hypothetical protein